jgi:nucleotide-binding universal stress UspA family protein
MTPRRILVPIDGRRDSESALPAAVERAQASGASLYLVYVVATAAPTAEGSLRHRATIHKAERYLAAARRRIVDDADLAVGSAVWSGSPAAAIVRAADMIDADLIVMARGGRTGPPRKLVGSVVERVLRGTSRPVLVITPGGAPVSPPPGDATPLSDRAMPRTQDPVADALVAPAGRQPRPGETYLAALRTLEECEREVLRVTATVRQAAKSLDHWQAVHVAHAGAGFPKEVTMMGRVIDATSWPTGRQLGEMLAAWHSAAEAVRVAWSRVPPTERSGFSPPP